LSTKGCAIVIGASIAGLFASQVLSNKFDSIVIIERDQLADEPKPRRGVPQSNHAHFLLAKGSRILADLFPNIQEELLANGAHKVDFMLDGRYLLPTGWAPSSRSGIVTYTCTRGLLELVIRKRVINNTKIRFLDNRRVTGLIFDKQKSRVIGVRISHAGNATDKNEEELYADFIVDASGQKSMTPYWLQQNGFPEVKETVINSDIGYATRLYYLDDSFREDWQLIGILSQPLKNPRMGVMYRVEKNQWIVAFEGIEKKNHPPIDNDGFLKFAADLASDKIYSVIKNAKPASNIIGYRISGSSFKHYEELSSWPENFIVIGDAVAHFNPFYAQGMTAAALTAKMLEKKISEFGERRIGFARIMQREITKINYLPWLLATGEDLRWSSTKGPRPSIGMRMMQKYVDKVLEICPNSILASQKFLEVMHMLRTPIVLFHPRILISLLLNLFKK